MRLVDFLITERAPNFIILLVGDSLVNIHSKILLTILIPILSVILILDNDALAQMPSGSLEKERRAGGPYFRFKVNLLYKGKPQSFNYVAGCNARITKTGDGISYEAGLIPDIFGRRMPDNKGLVISTPDVCRGETTDNGLVPKDFVPVMAVFDDADHLSFGLAYVTRDAFKSPHAELSFIDASVESATKEEFEEFRAHGEQNLVTRQQYYYGRMGNEKLKRDYGYDPLPAVFGWTCLSYARYHIPERARERFHKEWVKRGKPRYWAQSDAEKRINNVVDIKEFTYRYRQTETWHEPVVSDRLQLKIGKQGLANVKGQGFIGDQMKHGDRIIPRIRYPLALYPAVNAFNLYFQKPHSEEEYRRFFYPVPLLPNEKIDFRDGEMRGFAYCAGGFRTPLGRKILDEAMIQRKGQGLTVVTDRNGDPIPVLGPDPADPSTISLFFEEDKYYFLRTYQIGLGSSKGDL